MAQKSVLVTGCSPGGIGYAIAQEFQRRGLLVFATARNTPDISSLSELPNVQLLALDVTSPSTIASAVEQVKHRTGGRLDFLFNNSGQQYYMPALDVDIEAGKRMFDVNFWGVLRMVQAFSPLLVEAKGTVVEMGSVAGLFSVPFMSVYDASKAALHSLDSAMRVELAPLGVKVLTIMAGAVKTSLMKKSPEMKLPPASRYLPIEKDLSDRAAGTGDDFSLMQPGVFAQQVVHDVLKGATGKIWRGSYSTTTRYAVALLGDSVMVSVLQVSPR
ncbi:putative hydroxybutyrate dehydrogenase [Thozetella sp. PMI_491]|nr:putative hydroxybutyrate dehydrogenase [Thozetella sp. PMI_491]